MDIKITPAMMKALTAPMPNFHDTWRRYASSEFRRDWLKAWAGDDLDKLRAVDELLAEQPGEVIPPSPELDAAIAARDALKIGPTIYKRL